jgi:hypothetical protein
MAFVHAKPAPPVSRKGPGVADAAAQLVHPPGLSKCPHGGDDGEHHERGEDCAGNAISRPRRDVHAARIRRRCSRSESTT